MYKFSENALEEAAMVLFESLGYEAFHCKQEWSGDTSSLGRKTQREVVLVEKLKASLERLNPQADVTSLETAIEELTKDRSALNAVIANQEVHQLIKDGVRVQVREPNGSIRGESLKVIDWDIPGNNDFFLASQFVVAGDLGKKIPDLLGFVNGLPIVFIELKSAHNQVINAYKDNLSDYKNTIPHLFWYNTLVLLSNGSESRIGTISSQWEHFAEWSKIESENEEKKLSLETTVRGTCDKARLLDLIENFTLFVGVRGAPIKLVAKNHQYLGVNNAVEALRAIENNKGKLGVFWHTQGSGKSYSMIFFSQKVLRKIPGNWSFVIVTDRQELDNQIYDNFTDAGVVTEDYTQASTSAHLRQLLSEDHRLVFSLIHKFRTEPGQQHPVLSERSDIIVITDEAHRSQYDTLANNMRNALPNASFLAFTGTPLIVGEERTKDVFGDYVSVYDFKQSIEDNATVPLYYENRIPELQLTNEDLDDDMHELIEDAELDEEQEQKVAQQFSRQYHLITREDRLETIAKNLVAHFMGRGFQGKAMVVAIDKITAVRMYDLVKKHWAAFLDDLKARRSKASHPLDRVALDDQIAYMAETDMAVVVSQSQNEGPELRPHRQRMVAEKLDEKFKAPDDPFRIAFVCGMWMTGFDVPSCSTIYIDKPMKNHTLMQTIARANRVFGDKVNGLIVDYVGVFTDLQRALAIYGQGGGSGDSPVLDKARLVEALDAAIATTEEFLAGLKVEVAAIVAADTFMAFQLVDDAVEAVLVDDATKKAYLNLSGDVNRLFKAILPDARANEFVGRRSVIREIERRIRSKSAPVDISEFMKGVGTLLNDSVATDGYLIGADAEDHIKDLSLIDFGALKARFDKGKKNTEVERLKSAIDRSLAKMVEQNPARVDFMERFQQLIDDYNAGSMNVDIIFQELVTFTQMLNDEEQRHIRENLTEEELALFDILTRPDMQLTEKETEDIKQVCRELLNSLKADKLVLDWKKWQNTDADVRVTIETALDAGLPPKYEKEVYDTKCSEVYSHIYDAYSGEGKSIYES